MLTRKSAKDRSCRSHRASVHDPRRIVRQAGCVRATCKAPTLIQGFDVRLQALFVRIHHAIESIGAKRVVLDAILKGSFFVAGSAPGVTGLTREGVTAFCLFPHL